MPDVLTWLRTLPPPAVLLVGAVLVTGESALLIGVVTPGASAVLALGVLARFGVVPPVLAAGTAALAAVLGTQTAYLRGRRCGLRTPAVLDRPRRRAEDLLRTRGPVALVLGQWLIGVRTIAPRLAGSSGLGYRRFALASVPAALAWGSGLTMVGYLAGVGYQQVSQWLGLGTASVLVLVAAVVLFLGRRARA